MFAPLPHPKSTGLIRDLLSIDTLFRDRTPSLAYIYLKPHEQIQISDPTVQAKTCQRGLNHSQIPQPQSPLFVCTVPDQYSSAQRIEYIVIAPAVQYAQLSTTY